MSFRNPPHAKKPCPPETLIPQYMPFWSLLTHPAQCKPCRPEAHNPGDKHPPTCVNPAIRNPPTPLNANPAVQKPTTLATSIPPHVQTLQLEAHPVHPTQHVIQSPANKPGLPETLTSLSTHPAQCKPCHPEAYNPVDQHPPHMCKPCN